MSREIDRSEPREMIRQLSLEYAAARRRSDVAWIYVQQPRDGDQLYGTFSYVPEYHFRRAYDRLTRDDLEPDGGYSDLHTGTTPSTVYYWYDPDTGAVLEHTGVNDEQTVPFFPDEVSAHEYLEHRAAARETAQYAGLSLYRAQTRKVGDAVDVLTDQAGVDDFLPDGGRPIDRPDTNPAGDVNTLHRALYLADPARDRYHQGYRTNEPDRLEDRLGQLNLDTFRSDSDGGDA